MQISKKAMTAGFLVSIMITLVSFVLISGTIVNFTSNSEDSTAEQLCHSSIALRAKTVIKTEANIPIIDIKAINAEAKPVPVLCKTNDIKLKSSLSRKEIKKEIADKVARCWWMFGEGRYEEIIGDSVTVKLFPNLFDVGTVTGQCFNCYTIEVKAKEIPADDEYTCEGKSNCPIPYEELLTFMFTEPYKEGYVDCDGYDCKIECKIDTDCGEKGRCEEGKCKQYKFNTYLNYIQSYGGPGILGILVPEIKGGESYTLSFLPKTKPFEGGWLSVYTKALSGSAVAGIAFAGGVLICTAVSAGTCLLAVVPVALKGIAMGGSITATGISEANDIIEYNNLGNIFKDRENSAIYISDLETGQKMCESGDLAGE